MKQINTLVFTKTDNTIDANNTTTSFNSDSDTFAFQVNGAAGSVDVLASSDDGVYTSKGN